MTGYALRRLLQLVPVLLGISIVVFFITALLPGDPALAILGPYATPESLASLRAELGLDRPVWQRYVVWLGNVVQGDLGRSVTLQRPVIDEIAERLGPTLLLAGTALGLSVVLGLAAGAVAAAHRQRWQDNALTLAVLLGISTPQFWLALLLVLVFAVWLQWLPASGMISVYGGGDLGDLLRHLVLPTISLALVATGVLARLGRTAMLEELSQDYVRMARAKGLTERQVVYRHAFRSMLGRMMPLIGLQAGFLLSGAVYVETVFQWPGMGRMLVDAISTRDLLLVQGGVLVLASAYVLVNLLADVLQHLLDPRVRLR
ncbi:MAG: ABC transporter permease [Thiocapsa sp.]|nr:ABC transporter permease [Thiocapsa sp.]MCG6896358.1 ABC transporter permease [Thiocapsa sp.]MCG6985037.1 ABC transporter permease [Thiocapsa sp.]